MTDTTIRNTGAGQFCGNCGAAVRAYWNSCAACGTPLEVTAAADLVPSPAEAAPDTPPRAPRSWSGGGSDTAETWAVPIAPADPPPPAWAPPPPPPATPQAPGYAPTGGAYPPPPGYATTGAAYAPPPPAYAPNGPNYAAPAAYPPPQGWSPTAQYPAASPSYQSPYVPDPPSKTRSGRSGVLLALTIVLAVLLLGAGAYGVITAGSLSSKKGELVTRTKERDAARTALATVQGQLNDANTAKDSQSSQLAAYKACISDLNILFNSTTGTAAAIAADRQAQKDCIPVGLG